VLAALTAGLVVGNYRSSGSTSDAGRHALETFWEYAAFLANSLIFILIGAQEAEQHFSGLWLAILVAIALVTLGRAVAIHPLCAVFADSPLKVESRHQHILFWGGLRGALALALALALPDDLPPRRHCHDHLRGRRLLRIRTRVDNCPAAAPPRTNQVPPMNRYDLIGRPRFERVHIRSEES